MRAARQHLGIEFVGIAGRDETEPMQDFVDQYGIEFPNLVDANGDLWRHFGVPGQPAWVFVSASGETRRVLGAPNESELQLILENLAAT